ncbi:MAG: tetraacyldisaccharide 4'-kinase [bacterium]|nr:tetraacyldisaccharide 4'-kinase [bacterium]
MDGRRWREMVERERGGLLSALLLPASLLYRLGVASRHAAYRAGLVRRRRLPRPVVSVGNLVAGGTGKTPAVRLLAAGLLARGIRPAVLSRGYGAPRRGAPPLVVSDGTRPLLGAGEAGDEPVMLARALPGVPVIVDPDRARGGEAAMRFDPGVFILDDGFQHLRLARDADILLLDCRLPFGNGRLLPAGLLREPPSALRRADIIVLTRCESPPDPSLLSRIGRENPRARLFTARHEPARLVELTSGAARGLASLAGARVAAFAGTGRPDDFFETLRSCGAAVVAAHAFPDHHPYLPAEIAAIAAGASSAGASAIVTTEKDAARLPAAPRLPVPLLALGVEMRICGGGDDLLDCLLGLIGRGEAQ